MQKKLINLIILILTALIIGSCDNDDFVNPYDPSYTLPGPSNLNIEQIAVNKCRLTWQDNSLSEEGFKIARKKDNEDWNVDYATVTESLTEYIDSNIIPNSEYKYRVKACYDEISSEFIETTINTEFSPPRNLQIVQTSPTSVRLTWEDNNQWEEGFKIARKKDTDDWIEEYAVLEQNSLEYEDNSILPNSEYVYRVMSYYETVNSDFIETSVNNEFTPPSNLQIVQTSLISVYLSWVDNNQGEDGFKIARKKDNEDWIEEYAVLGANSQEYEDSDIESSSIYLYRVKSFYQDFESAFVEEEIYTIPDNFVLVPAGTFTMGRTTGTGDSDEVPTHQVSLSSFYIGKYEVTQAEYQAVMGTNPSYFSGLDKPVEQVSWYDAVEYCNARSIQEGLTPCYNTSTWECDYSANGYRLPTEAEWEYAARGGTYNPDYLYAGSDDINSVAWYYDNSSSTTHNVGTKAPNGLGIYDMSGNVYEWCNDWYGSYSSNAQTNPVGPASGYRRVYRGGSWYGFANFCRVAYRNYYYPSNCYNYLGFRLARRLN